jgi:hypothetical protein
MLDISMQKARIAMTLDKQIAELIGFPILKDPTELGKAMTEKQTVLFETDDGLIGIVRKGKVSDFTPSTEIEQAMSLFEEIAKDTGYNGAIRLLTLFFKSETEYMTEYGYPLGTTCWVVAWEQDGRRHKTFGQTPSEAICLAFIKYKEGEKK